VFGALLGSMVVFKVADDLGRRRELLIGSFFYFVASIIEASAANSSWDVNAGVTVLLLGRVLYGLGCGFSMHGAPAYSK
jgi:MFS family permease